MAKRNTGKPSEEIFEEVWQIYGKRAWCFRLADAAEVYGRTGGKKTVRSQPSDYILVVDGRTSFSEVKSSQDQTAFRFSLLKTSQSGPARMIVAAGGLYEVFIHHLLTDTWYRVPFEVITAVKEAGKASIPWANLKEFEWHSPTSWSTSRRPELPRTKPRSSRLPPSVST